MMLPDSLTKQPFFYASMAVVIFGLMYLIIIPPCEAPDEPAHFARAYGIAEGQFVLKDHPRELLEFTKKNMKRNKKFYAFVTDILRENKHRFKNLAFNTAIYAPVPYMFHSAIIKIASLITRSKSNFKVYFYCARAVSLTLFIGVIVWLCMYSNDLKWIVFWIFTNPMALAQASTVNIDVVIFCSSILILLSTFQLEKKSSFFLIIISGFFLMLSKPVYTPILILPLIILLIKDIKKKYSKLLWLSLAYAAMFVAELYWWVVSRKYGIFDHYLEALGSTRLTPRGHLIHALTSPFDFFNILFNSLLQNGGQIYHQFVGVFAWLDVPVSLWITVLWGIFAIITLFLVDREPLNFTKKQAMCLGLAFIAVALLCFILIVLSAYMLWTPVSSKTIGLQGRYFHVVVATLLLGMALLKPKFNARLKTKKFLEWGVVVACLVIHSSALYTLFNTFWL